MFRPDSRANHVVVSNYNGEPWPAEVNAAFEKFVRQGGGFVSYHAANNAFPEWQQYNEMIGIGGWGNRTEKSGPYARWRDGEIGSGKETGSRGDITENGISFVITTRNRITSQS